MKETWYNAIVSPCETHHLLGKKPLYDKRYIQVMKFHEPGLAPAKDTQGAFHIDYRGEAFYKNRYHETFGFYDGLASVNDGKDWFHITLKGLPAYKERYAWCGNFQEGYCPVRDKLGYYFHINRKGKKTYPERYRYVGDFKDGIAVICNHKGLHTHINYRGEFIHKHWFLDCDVFHKGYARAKDKGGWFHVNKEGHPIYSSRYAEIEPFYNQQARVKMQDGTVAIINRFNKVNALIAQSQTSTLERLSDEMVGFWRTETIATAVRLKIFHYLPATAMEITKKKNIFVKQTERLLRALWELNLIEPKKKIWHLTKKGKIFSMSFLASASIMWSKNAESWKHLTTYMQRGYDKTHSLFKAKSTNKELKIYHEAIDGYAEKDFLDLKMPKEYQAHQKVIGVGRSAKALLDKLLLENKHQKGVLLGEKYTLKFLNIEPSILSRYQLHACSLLKPWSESVDAILLPKVLHYWPDREAKIILKNVYNSLLPKGKVYIFEMVLKPDSPAGSLLDLNMLVESGGKLRFYSEWEKLCTDCKFVIHKNITIKPWLNLLILQKRIEGEK